jgi:hypothetical protein
MESLPQIAHKSKSNCVKELIKKIKLAAPLLQKNRPSSGGQKANRFSIDRITAAS